MARDWLQDDKHIVNVSAAEGQFYKFKTPYHPHTNMAKVRRAVCGGGGHGSGGRAVR